MKSEAYYNGYDDAMNNYLAEHYGQRPHMFSGDFGDKEEYGKGYKDGWEEADRIDDVSIGVQHITGEYYGSHSKPRSIHYPLRHH